MKTTRELQERLNREVGTYGIYGKQSLERLGLKTQKLTAQVVTDMYWMELTADVRHLEAALAGEGQHAAEIAEALDVLSNPAYR